jgi:hypothetical protein
VLRKTRRGRLVGPVLAAVAAAISLVTIAGAAPQGTGGADVLTGSRAADVLNGRGGNDVISGRAGADRLFGGPGRDFVLGGAGNDRIVVRDGQPDAVSCGPGVDRVTSDARDVIAPDCERLTPGSTGRLQLAVNTGNGQQSYPSTVQVSGALREGSPTSPCTGPSEAGQQKTVCWYSFVVGRPVTLTAVPFAPQTFRFWSTTIDDVCRVRGERTCTISPTVPAVGVIAIFE